MSAKYLFIFIFVVGLFLRLYNINGVPPSPSLDEVSIGYNAYSILHTGRDEYGTFLPLLLRAYDDYRPALYVYLVVPFVALLGLTIQAVRLPSVVLSLVSLITIYFLIKELLPKNISFRKIHLSRDMIAFLTMLFVSISPWHIYLSRLGHEVNLGFVMTVLGVLFFLRSINREGRVWDIVISAICFSLSFYSYQSQKIIVPVMLLGLFLLYFSFIKKHLKSFIIAGLVGIVLTIPVFLVSISDEGRTRFEGTTVFDATHPLHNTRLQQFTKAKEDGDILGQIYYNRRLTNIVIFSNQYLSHFSPHWLFMGTEKEDHKVPNLGLMYPWEFPLIVIGLFVLVRSNIPVSNKLFVGVWILASPLAASITTGAPHAMRSFTFIPTWQILSSLGIVYSFQILRKYIPQIVLYCVFIFVIIVSVAYFFYQYFVMFPVLHSRSFQYSLSAFLNTQKIDEYDSPVIVSNQDQLTQSYMFYLFYSKYDPHTYIKDGGTQSGGFAETHKINSIEFRPIEFENERAGAVLVGNVTDFPSGVYYEEIYKLLDGTDGLVVVRK